MSTLTRADAHQLIDDLYADGTADEMRALAAHWELSGWWNENTDKDDWYQTLHEHVDNVATTQDDCTLRDSDPTELTAGG